MTKRYAHHLWTKLRRIKPWYFLILAILSTVICIFALRANNEHMVKLKEAVYTADKNNDNVSAALGSLQAYVTAHMNTNLNTGPNAVYPPIQLKYTYERLTQAQKSSQTSDELYTAAQHYCEGQNSTDFSGRNRVPCITQYVKSHGGGQAPAASIPDALYKFDFVSPKWSPDLAGWSMVVAALSWVLFVVTLIASWLLRRSAT
jgi:hypothetical protein